MLVTDRKRFPAPGVGEVFSEAEWRVLEEVVRAGVGAIQLREKDLDGGPLLERARALVSLCRPRGVLVLVNGRVDVAVASDADGVHLPAAGLEVCDARALVGPEKWVGRSIHSVGELEECRGADYVLFGPIYDTPAKRIYGRPQGPARLREVAAEAALPVVAVGGIGPECVPEILGCGVGAVAAIGGLLGVAEPAAEVARFRAALDRGRSDFS
jgi:thiamine-phosphate pyrophosphorylase